MDLKNRRRTNVSLDIIFWEWLTEQSKKTGTPISRILEIATMKQYETEYQEFLNQRKEKESEK